MGVVIETWAGILANSMRMGHVKFEFMHLSKFWKNERMGHIDRVSISCCRLSCCLKVFSTLIFLEAFYMYLC